MPSAYPPEIAYRVLWCLWWHELPTESVPKRVAEEIAYGPLQVSESYVLAVWERFWWYGNLATHQGAREAAPANRQLTSL